MTEEYLSLHEREIREVRAKVINEFAEHLHELCGFEIDGVQYPYLLHESRINEIAEKMRRTR